MTAVFLPVESLDHPEDYLIFAAAADSGELLDEESARRLLTLPGQVIDPNPEKSPAAIAALDAFTQRRRETIQREISERNAKFFEAEADELEGWSDDLKLTLEREIKELDRQIKEARRAATAALTLEDKLAGQKQIKALEKERNERRRSLFDAQDQVDRQRDALIAQIERKLPQHTAVQSLFCIRWHLS
jgi:adenine-specific DNA-methyltransferase